MCVCESAITTSAPGEKPAHTHQSYTPETATRENLGVSHSPYRERERSFTVRRREDDDEFWTLEFTRFTFIHTSHTPVATHVTRTRLDREQHHIMRLCATLHIYLASTLLFAAREHHTGHETLPPSCWKQGHTVEIDTGRSPPTGTAGADKAPVSPTVPRFASRFASLPIPRVALGMRA